MWEGREKSVPQELMRVRGTEVQRHTQGERERESEKNREREREEGERERERVSERERHTHTHREKTDAGLSHHYLLMCVVRV